MTMFIYLPHLVISRFYHYEAKINIKNGKHDYYNMGLNHY